jgi:hypothetical protein
VQEGDTRRFLPRLILRSWTWRRCFSETSVDFQQTSRRYIPEDSTLHNHRCENLKSYMNLFTSPGEGVGDSFLGLLERANLILNNLLPRMRWNWKVGNDSIVQDLLISDWFAGRMKWKLCA